MGSAVEVRKSALEEARIAGREPGDLEEGAIRLAIESFSITANNVTYAVVGDGFGYWNFFPAPEGWGVVPVWGHAQVSESRHADFAVGERVYGYLPMADTLDVFPGKVSAGSFVDLAEHRQPMSPIYNTYQRLAADPEHDPAREGERMIFGPLFKTGFLIESFLRRENWFGAETLVMTSASSKTAMGLASVARHRSPQIKRVGLTSHGNTAFVNASGLFDEVLPYEAANTLGEEDSVFVDFAGNSEILRQVHESCADGLRYSCLVGATHIDARGGGARDLPGPPPTLFFAPDHALALLKDLGPQEFGNQVAESWHRFLAEVAGTVEIERRPGLEEARAVFTDMVAGNLDPAKGIVIEP